MMLLISFDHFIFVVGNIPKIGEFPLPKHKTDNVHTGFTF